MVIAIPPRTVGEPQRALGLSVPAQTLPALLAAGPQRRPRLGSTVGRRRGLRPRPTGEACAALDSCPLPISRLSALRPSPDWLASRPHSAVLSRQSRRCRVGSGASLEPRARLLRRD